MDDPKQYIKLLSDISHRLYSMANATLEQLDGKCTDPEETQDYYVGLLRRQAQLTYDLHTILVSRPKENLTTPYIILRALLDDFLHVLYLDLSDNIDEEIVCINAKGHRDNFKSLKNLTDSENQEYHGQNFGYLSEEAYEELKIVFKSKPKNQKYFTDIDNFELKGFKTMAQMALSINSTENNNIARDRTYFYWKSFSSFVHYSTWCYDYETTGDILKLKHMEESLQYVFNTIHFCSCYFRQTKGTNCYVDKFLLKEMKFALLKPTPDAPNGQIV